MKRIIFAFMLILFATTSFAQATKEDQAVIQSVFQKDKADLIKASLPLSEAQGQAFWPIYEQYEAKRLALSNTRLQIISDYLKSYDTLTDAEAATLVGRVFSSDKEYTNLQKSYYRKFSGAIGGKNAARFYQLENYLQQVVRLKIQSEIPFIGELDGQKH